MEEKDTLKQINYIIKSKWQELEVRDNKEKLKELVMNLHSFDDYEKEYLFTAEKIEEKEDELTEEEIDRHMKSFFEKWSFVFLSIMNMDIQNPFLFSYMFETLLEIEDEFYLED